MDLIHIGLAFLEGLGLILSPCILPILPIVLAAGVEGGRRRPYGIILGFVFAFTALSLLSRVLIQIFGIDTETLRMVSIIVLMIFGLILISNYLSDKFSQATQNLATWGNNLPLSQQKDAGFLSGIGLGIAIGFVWTPCAGPIMAAAIVEVIRAKTHATSILTMLAFALGAGLPMLAIILGGRAVMEKGAWFKTHSEWIRKALGVIILLAAIAQTQMGSQLLSETEEQVLPDAMQSNHDHFISGELVHALGSPYPAPEITGIQAWINSKPLQMKDLKGKVVLVDFWTYSCINCVRTLPYLTDWYAKYKDKGFVILGIHSPEFEFEKKLDNVQAAVKEHHILYPVALDNNLNTWENFSNLYWPAHYLIDREGQVVYTHFGEGEYDVTEHNIETLLGLSVEKSNPPTLHPHDERFMWNETPETYLGSARADNFSSPEKLEDGDKLTFSYPKDLPRNHWALEGNWAVYPEVIVAKQDGASLKLNFTAKKVFLVLGAENNTPLKVKIKLNNAPKAEITVDRETLYTLLELPAFGRGELELEAPKGLHAYAFTFGSD